MISHTSTAAIQNDIQNLVLLELRRLTYVGYCMIVVHKYAHTSNSFTVYCLLRFNFSFM